MYTTNIGSGYHPYRKGLKYSSSQAIRTALAKTIISRVVESNPSKGYNNPTTIAGGIFSTLINDLLNSRGTPVADLVKFHEDMSGKGTVEGTTLQSLKRVMQYLNAIGDAIDDCKDGGDPIELVVDAEEQGYFVRFG